MNTNNTNYKSFFKRCLNDSDDLLKKAGIGLKKLYYSVISDGRVDSNWNYRVANVISSPYILSCPQEEEAKEVVDFVNGEFLKLDIEKTIAHILKSIALGFSVFEIIWESRGDFMGIKELRCLPTWWFDFNSDGQLIYKEDSQVVDEANFLLVQNDASFENPYGNRLFSKLYWLVIFKQNANKWWASFVEKYASPFLYGVYPENSSQDEREELLYALEELLGSSVGIGPEGSKIQIYENTNKSGSSQSFLDFLNFINREISITILGQNLTTEVSGDASYASAKVHQDVRKDISSKDKRLVEKALSNLAIKIMNANFVSNSFAINFKFLNEFNLNRDFLERDKELFNMGIRFTDEYFIKYYGLSSSDFYLGNLDAKNNSNFKNAIKKVLHMKK